MFGRREGTGKGATFKFFSIFSVKFHTLGTRKLFKSDQISLTVINKTAVWGKMCGENPQRGDKKVFKCHTYAGAPLPLIVHVHLWSANIDVAGRVINCIFFYHHSLLLNKIYFIRQ